MNDVINKYLSNITKISYINSNVYIETFDNNYIVLDKKIDKNKLFDFFRKVDFNFFKYSVYSSYRNGEYILGKASSRMIREKSCLSNLFSIFSLTF